MTGSRPPGPAGTTFRILGRLEAVRDGVPLDLGPPKQRALLAILLCRADSVVSTGSLIEALWPNDPPRSAPKNLQSYASGLRRLVQSDDAGCLLTHQAPGYRISVPAGCLDLRTFETLLRDGRSRLRAGDHAGAVRALRAGMDLWQSPPLEEFSAFPVLWDEAERLESRRLTGYEDLIEAELARGPAEDVLEEIDDLCWAHPLRERLRYLQMAALHRSGRQAEALSVYDEVRQRLARELGLSPSPVLQRMYSTVLGDESPVPVDRFSRPPVGSAPLSRG